MTRRLAMSMDKLYHASFDRLRKGMYQWIHAQHNEQPEDTLCASGAMFLLLCRNYRIEPRRALEVAERVLRDAEGFQAVNIRALKRLIREEMPRA